MALSAAESGHAESSVPVEVAAPDVDAAAVERWNAHFQATGISQAKPSFNAPHSGPASLKPEAERSYSITATAFLGVRAWSGGELYVDPEMAMGRPLSNLTGLAGFTNAEIAKSVGESPNWYRARLFLRQTWNPGGGDVVVDSGANQLAGTVKQQRVVLTAGNFASTRSHGTPSRCAAVKTM